MKLLYITSLFPTQKRPVDGIFNLFRVHALKAQGIDVEVLLLNSAISNYKKSIDWIPNYSIKDLSYCWIKYDARVTVKNYVKIPFLYQFYLDKVVKKRLKEFKPSIVHYHFLWDLFGIDALKKQKIPYLITCHGSDIHTLPKKSKKVKNRALKILNEATHVMFVSKALHQIAESLGFTKKKYSITPNGIDPTLFYPEHYQNLSKERGACIGFVGNLLPVKRVQLLPKIFEYIKQKQPNTSLHIIGDGPLRHEIVKNLEEKGLLSSTVFTGKIPIEKVGDELRKLDVLLLPSLNEGWPCVCLEAQACGVAVVGSSNGGVPEALGDAGIIVKEGNLFSKRFAEAVIKLLREPISSERLVNRASQFHWDRLIRDEIECYTKL